MKKIISTILSAVLTLSLVLSSAVSAQGAQTSDRVQQLLNQMTLEQKVGQMLQPDTRSITPEEVAQYYIGSILSGGGASPSTGNSAADWAARADEYQKAAIEGFGIPLLYGVDAVHGHNNVDNAVMFPHNVGLGQTGNPELVAQIGEITAKEIRATGANWTFTPTLGLPKNERWGRTYECYGENAELSAAMGAAYITGSQGAFGEYNAIATAKHFVGEGITTDGVNQGDVPMEYDSVEFQTILREELLTPYKSAIAAGVKSVMVSYNSIGGEKCHGNQALLTSLLKNELGFEGIVISDYNGVDQIEGDLTYAQKVQQSINAGMDMLMVDGSEGTQAKWKAARQAIIDGVNSGVISMDRINDAVTRILRVKDEMGLLANPESAYANRELLANFACDEYKAVARQAVSESLTLLKNTATQNGTSTIMQDLAGMDKIVVAGSSANDIGMQCGGWTIWWQGFSGAYTEGTTIYDGLKEAAGAGKTVDLKANGYFTADDYDAAIVVVGEAPYAESGGDRAAAELKLSDDDIAVINTIKEEHPDLPIIAVLTTGRPITIADQIDLFDAVIMAGFPGTEGAGVADVLLGDQDFTGHLTYTWPWYAQDIEEKFTDSSKVLFEYGRGLTKAETTPIATEKPEDPTIVDLGATNGVLEAENFSSKHADVVLENDGTTIGYFWEGRDIVYKVKVPESGSYKITVSAATANTSVDVAMSIYVDGTKACSVSDTLGSTGGWAVFQDMELSQEINLPAGEHTLQFVSQSRDFNIDKFKFTKNGEYTAPEEGGSGNTGSGSVIGTGKVAVSMSSSENSGSQTWYAGEQKIENKNTEKEALDIRNADSSNITTITVDDDKEYQTVLGIGISMEESTVNNLLKMSDSARAEFIRNLVDPENGMGVTLIRVTIGTPDFTGQEFYTYYDGTGTELNGSPDWYNETGNGFTIQKDIDYGIVGVLQEIIAAAEDAGTADQLRFFASSWTPPGWMKTPTGSSNSYSNNDKLLKGGDLNDDYIDELAKYYVRYLEEYYKQGICLYAMTLQNEPLLEIDYPSCHMTGTQEAKLARAIKEELANSTVLTGDAKDVKVWAFDHNFDGAASFVNELFQTAEGRDNVDGIAFHPYGGNATTMGELYNTYSGIYSMHLTERSVWGTGGANDIITWFRNGAESYNSWVTMLDSNISPHQWVGTPDPTLFVKDAESQDGYWCTPEVYITGQFSRYVRPGYVRIDSSAGSTATVTNVAFKNPETGEIVLIVTNCSGTDQDFKVVLDGTQFNATLPAGNVATYRWMPVEATDFKTITDDLALSDAVITGTGTVSSDGTVLNGTDSTTKVSYQVNVKQAGTYKAELQVAATAEDSEQDLHGVISAGGTELGRTSIRKYITWDDAQAQTGFSWIQTYVTFEQTGLQTVEITFPEGGINFRDVQFTKENDTTVIPGILDTTNSFYTHGIMKEDNVPDFGFISYDDYIDYKVNVSEAGVYTVVMDVAVQPDTAGIWVDTFATDSYAYEASTGSYVGPIELVGTGGTDQFTQQTASLTLAAGEQVLRFKFGAYDVNVKSIRIGNAITVSDCDLTEGALDGQSFTVALGGSTFASTAPVKDNWTINLPAGVDFILEKTSDTTVKVTLKGEAQVDFDTDMEVTLSVAAAEFAAGSGTPACTFVIKAVDDAESLSTAASIPYGTETVELTITNGTFRDDLDGKITLDGTAAKYVTIQSAAKKDANTAAVTLLWNPIYASSVDGIFCVAPDAYDEGNTVLSAETIFGPTDGEPEAISVGTEKVFLLEELAYRNEGTLAAEGGKGSYADFYLDVAEAGDYVISYHIKTSETVANGLKLSGGAGYATDNLASLSFAKFWDNTVEYRSSLTLKAGRQTLRIEKNAGDAGFVVTDIAIQAVSYVEIGAEAVTIGADNAAGGSNDVDWGIEVKDDIADIGYQTAGSYQDYYVNVKTPGVYTFRINAGGSSSGTPTAVLQQVVNGEAADLGRVEAPVTGSWDTFEDSETAEVQLEAGKQILRIYNDGSGFNYRSFTLTLKESSVVEPAKVTGVTAVYENGQIQVTWDDCGADIYQVVRTDGRSGYTTLTYRATAAGWTDTTDLVDAQLYYYRVIGYFKDANGALVKGDMSDAAGVVATDHLPAKVENVQASVSDGTVTLTWDKADGARYYKVARASGATGTYYCRKYNIETLTYSESSVAAGLYRYKVVGYYKDIDGSWVYGDMCDTLYVRING